MKKVSLRALIHAFNASPATNDYWEEHGIDDEETAHGIRAVLDTLGIAYKNDVVFEYGQLTTRKELAEKEAYRKAHPPPPEPEWLKTLMNITKDNVINDYVVQTFFGGSKLDAALKIKESPNKEPYSR